MKKPKAKTASAPGACSGGPSLKPQNITKDAWYYEYRGGIELVIWTTWGDGSSHPLVVKIPWGKLQRSLARCNPNHD